MQNEKRYFLKNSNLLEEVHKSKLTYCCYEKPEYGQYDIICEDYNLITPNIMNDFFKKNPNNSYIIIRVMTNEHVLPYCKNGKVNLQELKMSPFKHFLIDKDDFEKTFENFGSNLNKIDELNLKISNLKEKIKDNNRNIRLNQQTKDKQIPFKENNKLCKENIENLTNEIKKLSETFSTDILKDAKEVLRSHWKGDTIESGHFDISQGRLSDGLVYMIIMLVDQFAKSGNWSGYTYLDDMKGSALVHLCDVALKFEESKSNNVFSYLTQVASNKFTATLNSEKTQRRIKSKLMQEIGYNPTFNEQLEEEFKNILYDDDGNEIVDEPEDIEENSDNYEIMEN